MSDTGLPSGSASPDDDSAPSPIATTTASGSAASAASDETGEPAAAPVFRAAVATPRAVMRQAAPAAATQAPPAPTLAPGADTGSSAGDGITSDATPVVTGTAVAGATITLYDSDGTTMLGTATADSTGVYAVAVTMPLDDGDHTLTLTAKASGFDASAPSPGLKVTIDTAAPDAPTMPTLTPDSDTGKSKLDGITASSSPVLTGIAEPGSTVSLYADGGTKAIASAQVDASGAYSFAVPTMADGTYQFTVVATDVAGNQSKASAAAPVTIDRTKPATPAAPTLAPGSDTGVLSSDGLTDDITPVVTGTAEAGATVQLLDTDGIVLGTTTVAASGSYAITSQALTVGAHALTVTATDAAGNVSAASAPLNIVVDTSPASGAVTYDGSPEVFGSLPFKLHFAEPVNGVGLGDLVVQTTGSAQAEIAQISGSGSDYTVLLNGISGKGTIGIALAPTSKITDLAGNKAEIDTAISLSVDGSDTPTLTLVANLENGSDGLSSLSASGRLIAYDTIGDGTGPAGVFVKDLRTGGVTLVAGDDLNANEYLDKTSFTPVLSGNGKTIAFSSLANDLVPDAPDDGSENVYVATLDTTGVAAGQAVTVKSIQLVSQGNGQHGGVGTDYLTPEVLSADGTHVAFTSNEALVPGMESGEYNVFVKDLTTGVLTLVSKGSDGKGGDLYSYVTSISDDGSEVAFESDAKNLTSTPLDDDVGTLSYVYNTATSALTVIDGQPQYPTLGRGSVNTEHAMLSGSGTFVTYVVETPPYLSTPHQDIYELNLRTGALQELTGATQYASDVPSVSRGGRYDAYEIETPGQSLEIALDDAATSTVTTLASSALPTLSENGNALSFVDYNDDQSIINLYAETLGPTLGLAPLPNNGLFDASVWADATKNGLPISGETNAPDGSTILVQLDDATGAVLGGTNTTTNTAINIATVKNGAWSGLVPADLLAGRPDGNYVIVAFVNTATGSSFPAPAPFTVYTATPPTPVAPVLSPASDTGAAQDGSVTNQDHPVLTGTAAAGDTITLYDKAAPGIAIGRAVADANGVWALTAQQGDNVGLADGKYALFVTVTDMFGNTSAASPTLALAVDNSVPDRPGRPQLAIASDTGTLDNDGVTSNATPIITGKAEPKSTVTLYDSDGISVLGTATVDAKGNYAITSNALSDGQHMLSVTATDAAGNISPLSQTVAVTVDTAPPGAPAGLAATGSLAADGKLVPFIDVSGTAEPGSIVELQADGDNLPFGRATVRDDGTFDIDSDPLQPGDHKLTVVATDTAGNASQPSLALDVSITGIATPPPGTSSGTETNGIVSDGAISGATVFADANGDGVFEPGEAYTVTRSDGRFTLFGGSGELIAQSGIDPVTGQPVPGKAIDTITGLTLPGNLRAPSGASVITPLTTLLEAYGVATGKASTSGNTPPALLMALGLPAGTNLSIVDPSGAAHATPLIGNFELNAISLQIVDTVVAIAGVVVGAFGTASDSALQAHAFDAAFAVIAGRIAAGGLTIADLQSAAKVSSILVDTAHRLVPGATLSAAAIDATGQIVATGNAAIVQQANTLAGELPNDSKYQASQDYNAAIQYVDSVEQLEQGSAEAALQFGATNDSLAQQAVSRYTGAGFSSALSPPGKYVFVPFALAASSDTGRSDQDNVTSVTTPTFVGTAEPGATITLITPGPPDGEYIHIVGSAVVDATGHFSITTEPLADGTARQTDITVQAVQSGPDGSVPPVEGDPYPDSQTLTDDISILTAGTNPQLPAILEAAQAPGPGSDAGEARLAIHFALAGGFPQDLTARIDVYADGGTTPIASLTSGEDTGIGGYGQSVIDTSALSAGTHALTITQTLVSGVVLSGSAPFQVDVAPAATVTGTASANGPVGGGIVKTAIDGSYGVTTALDGTGAYVFPAASEQFLVHGWNAATGLPLLGALANDMPGSYEQNFASPYDPAELTAPAGATVISPFTHLIDILTLYLPSSDNSAATAEVDVLKAFGLPASLDLLSLDPLAMAKAGDATTFLLAEKLLNTTGLITAASANIGGFFLLAYYITQHGTIDLDNTTQLASLLKLAGVPSGEQQQLAGTIAASNAAIDGYAAGATGIADLVSHVLAVGTVALGAEAEAFIEANGKNNRDPVAAAQAASDGFTGANLTDQIDAALAADPQITGFAPADMATASSAATVTFRISFSQAVTGVTPAAFSVVTDPGLIDAHVTRVTAVPGSGGTAYDVAVSTGVGKGALSLAFDGTGALNADGRPLTGGSFEPEVTYADDTGSLNAGTSGTVALGDFNGDGRLDVVQAGGFVRAYLNQGGGVLAAQAPIESLTTLQAGSGADDVATGDFNGDGKLDIVTLNHDSAGNASVSVLLGNGDGSFQNPSETVTGTATAESGLAVGDIDGDGNLDVVSLVQLETSYTSSQFGVAVLLGNGDGTFHNGPMLVLPSATNQSISAEILKLADVNGDGKPDLLALDSGNNAVDVYLGNGDGTFAPGPEASVAAGVTPTAMAVGDVNGDGIADIVTVNPGDPYAPQARPGSITVLLGKGDGSFQAGTSITLPIIPEATQDVPVSPVAIAIGDVNNDGKPDLVLSGGAQLVLLGDGSGGFTPGQAVDAHIGQTSSIALGDLDGDGRPDIVSNGPGYAANSNVGVQLNAPQTVLSEPSAPIEIDRSALAQPAVSLASGRGSLVQFGTTYTLDLGTLAQGTSPAAITFAITNAASGAADALGGTFGAATGDGFAVTGAALTAALEAGESYDGLTFMPDTGTPGQHTETISFAPRDQSATTTAYADIADTDDTTATTVSVDGASVAAQLPMLTLVVKDSVAAGPPPAALGAPATVTLGNARIGDSDAQAIPVTNTAATGGGALSVTATASGGATVSGSATGIAPGTGDASDIVAALDTGSAGAVTGMVTLAPVSVDASGNRTTLTAVPVTISGDVFRTASAQASAPSMIVHVGDSGIVPIGVRNGDATDGFSEALVASLGALSPGLAASSAGPTGAIAAGASDASLAVQAPTATAGTISGTATIDLVSDGGNGPGSIDGLGRIALAPETVPIDVTVDNYAVAGIGETVNGVGGAAGATLDLGSVAIGATAPTVAITALNTASGPADTLGGSFSATGSAAFTNMLGDVVGIAAGGSASAGTVTLSTAAIGRFSETITFTPSGSNASGYRGALAPRTLTITGTVTAGAPATVTAVTTSGPGITGGAGDLGVGRTVTFTVDTSAPVTVDGGSPALMLDDGGTAVYSGGSGTAALTFTTAIAAGQASPDLTITGIALNGATIRDAHGGDADLSGAMTDPPGALVVATAAPTTTPAALTVMENAGATPIGIVAPTDPGYPAGRLSATITALPDDGTVALADGTAVQAGQALSIEQLAGLTFTAATGMFGRSATLAYSIADPAQNTASGSAVLAIGPALPATIAGVAATQTTSDVAALNPFADAVIADPSTGRTETVTVTPNTTANGTLSASAGGTLGAAGTYTVSGSAAHVTAALRGLVFTPIAHRVAPGDSVTTGFTVAVADDAGGPTTNETISVVTTAAEDAPAIGGTQASQTTTDLQPLQPFTLATIADPDLGALETVAITLLVGGAPSDADGTLSGAGLTRLGAGRYTLAAAAPADAQAALRALVFTPAAHQTAPGGTVTTGMTISVSDGLQSSSDAATTVVATAIADVPVIGGTIASQTIGDRQTIQPFAQATISDPDANETETTTITLTVAGAATDAGGTLSGDGLTQSGTGTYRLAAASPAAEQRLLRALLFTPSAGAAGHNVVTSFDLQVADSVASASDNGTTVTVTTPPVVPTVTLALATAGAGSSSGGITASAVLSGTAGPGDTITIANGAVTLGTVVADDTGAYRFTPTLADGSYTLTASDTNAAGTGSAALAFTLDTTPPVVTAPSLTVASGAGATPIGIRVSDASSTLTQPIATIEALPTDGMVTLNGVDIAEGQMLTAAQLAQLMFTPAADLASGSSALGYSVADAAGNRTTASDALLVAPGGGGEGDVHMTTFDGLHYDFQALGDFVIAQARDAAADDGFAIQMHTEEFQPNPGTSIATELAARVGQDVVQFGLGASPVTVNGVAVTLDGTDQLAGGSLRQAGDSWVLDWKTGESLTVTGKGHWFDFIVTPGAQDTAGALQGLLGSDTGQANDFQLRDGTVLDQPLGAATLEGQFADAWRVGAGESLLAALPASAAGGLFH